MPPSYEKAPPSADGGGICKSCPIQPTCAMAGDDYLRCPVTGGSPPPAPPTPMPAPDPVMPTADPWTAAESWTSTEPAPAAGPRRFDATEVASRGLETAIGAVTGFGWFEVVAGLVQRLNKEDADGNEIDWGRLQLARNGLCIALVTVPFGGTSAAVWFANQLAKFSIGAVLIPIGWACVVLFVPLIGSYAPGPIGVLCQALLRGAGGLCRGVFKFLCGRLGWIITRPAIWTVVIGIGVLIGRPLLRFLTGA